MNGTGNEGYCNINDLIFDINFGFDFSLQILGWLFDCHFESMLDQRRFGYGSMSLDIYLWFF